MINPPRHLFYLSPLPIKSQTKTVIPVEIRDRRKQQKIFSLGPVLLANFAVSGIYFLSVLAALIAIVALIKKIRQYQKELDLKSAALADQTNYREQAEALAEANRVLFDVAVEGVGLGVFTWIVATKEISYNQQWAAMMGYKLWEVEPNSKAWLDHIHPQETRTVKAAIIYFLRSGKDHYQFEHRVKTKTGEWKWIMAYLKVQERDSNGKALKVTGVHLDIDDMKHKQLELQKITRELMHSNTELQKFAYITSHNLRAPAVNLLSLAELYNYTKPDDEFNVEVVRKIHKSSLQLNETLNDLIEIVSQKPGHVEPTQNLNLAQETHNVLNSIDYLIKKEKAQVNLSFDHVPEINYSRKILHSVLLNLVSNAIKYKAPDRNPIVNIRSYRVGGNNFLDVTDNGQGIDLKKNKNKLFGLYQRFSRKTDGKGLGLFIIKSQIEAMNGTISVDSNVNLGTTFTIEFNKFERN